MLYRILDNAHMEHCQSAGMCDCMCKNNVVKWNNDHTKVIVLMPHECLHCNDNDSLMYTYDGIQTLLKNDASWKNKNIM